MLFCCKVLGYIHGVNCKMFFKCCKKIENYIFLFLHCSALFALLGKTLYVQNIILYEVNVIKSFTFEFF